MSNSSRRDEFLYVRERLFWSLLFFLLSCNAENDAFWNLNPVVYNLSYRVTLQKDTILTQCRFLSYSSS